MNTPVSPLDSGVAASPAIKQAVDANPLPTRSAARLALVRFTRNRLGMVGTLIVALFLFTAVFAPLLTPYQYDRTNPALALKLPGEAPGHILGTDDTGRDMLTRLIYGARTSLIIVASVQAIVIAIAGLLGFSAGWFGGRVDFLVNRLVEMFVAIPGLLFQILVIVVIGGGISNMVLAIALLSWPELTRLIRAQVLRCRESEYIEAAQAIGADTRSIAIRHVLPNIINPIIVALTFSIPTVILAESSLSFLGYGINEPTPSWGKMVGTAANYIQRFWHMGILPTACLSIVMIGFSFFGDSVRDALDPRTTRGS